MKTEIHYGKAQVSTYRTYATPLEGVTPIPESPFTRRPNVLMGAEIDVKVLGESFLAAYTEGDNRLVVATDSMKNFILAQSLVYDGATLEGLLAFLGRGFIATYNQIRELRLTGREIGFTPAQVPLAAGASGPSPTLFERDQRSFATATLELTGAADRATVTSHRSGQIGLQLMKITGSAFTSFVRDDYTTLPERRDRPLFIYVDIHWRYHDVADLLAPDPVRYVAAEQVRDLVQAVFHEFVSESIQHLVHEMGTRLLELFPQLSEVSFEAQNRTRDPFYASEEDPRVKVYSDPFSAYGHIALTMRRER